MLVPADLADHLEVAEPLEESPDRDLHLDHGEVLSGAGVRPTREGEMSNRLLARDIESARVLNLALVAVRGGEVGDDRGVGWDRLTLDLHLVIEDPVRSLSQPAVAHDLLDRLRG